MYIRKLTTTLIQIGRKIIFNFRVIVRSIFDPADASRGTQSQSEALTG